MIDDIRLHRDKLRALCRDFHVRRLELFGSAARGDFDPEHSDFDFLVEFDPSHPDAFSLKTYFGFKSVEAQSRLAAVLVIRALSGMADAPEADIARAERLVDRALATSPRYGHAHIVKGHVLRAQRRWEEAIPEYEVALELNQNSAYALTGLGWSKLYTGSTEGVTRLAEQAIRLSPRDPDIGYCYSLIGTAHLLQSHIDEAIVWLEKARGAVPAAPLTRSRLAAAYALEGETKRAAAELGEARRLSSDDRFSNISRLKAKAIGSLVAPKVRALFEVTYFAGLRLAGVPDE